MNILQRLKNQDREKDSLITKMNSLEMEVREAEGVEQEHQEIVATIRLIIKNSLSIKLGWETYEQLKAKVERKLTDI